VAASPSPTVRRRRLAAELRRLRGTRKAAPVAKALGWSIAKISRYENGAGSFPVDEVAKLLAYYDVREPRRGRLLALAQDANRRGWWEGYSDAIGAEYGEFIGLEAEAESVISWCITGIPGLLQTEDYAREVFASYQKTMPIAPSLVERRIRVRLIRQDVLTAREPPLRLSVVLDESALLRQIGGPKVMHAQLQHLAALSELPNVELRILSLDSGQSPPPAPFQVFSFPAEDQADKLGDVVFIEGMRDYLQVEGETEVDTYMYRLFFQALVEASLTPDDSRALLLSTARSRWALRVPHVFDKRFPLRAAEGQHSAVGVHAIPNPDDAIGRARYFQAVTVRPAERAFAPAQGRCFGRADGKRAHLSPQFSQEPRANLPR
jgi:transcriptional regulator with XRE-family HTH domain